MNQHVGSKTAQVSKLKKPLWAIVSQVNGAFGSFETLNAAEETLGHKEKTRIIFVEIQNTFVHESDGSGFMSKTGKVWKQILFYFTLSQFHKPKGKFQCSGPSSSWSTTSVGFQAKVMRSDLLRNVCLHCESTKPNSVSTKLFLFQSLWPCVDDCILSVIFSFCFIHIFNIFEKESDSHSTNVCVIAEHSPSWDKGGRKVGSHDKEAWENMVTLCGNLVSLWRNRSAQNEKTDGELLQRHGQWQKTWEIQSEVSCDFHQCWVKKLTVWASMCKSENMFAHNATWQQQFALFLCLCAMSDHTLVANDANVAHLWQNALKMCCPFHCIQDPVCAKIHWLCVFISQARKRNAEQTENALEFHANARGPTQKHPESVSHLVTLLRMNRHSISPFPFSNPYHVKCWQLFAVFSGCRSHGRCIYWKGAVDRPTRRFKLRVPNTNARFEVGTALHSEVLLKAHFVPKLFFCFFCAGAFFCQVLSCVFVCCGMLFFLAFFFEWNSIIKSWKSF